MCAALSGHRAASNSVASSLHADKSDGGGGGASDDLINQINSYG